MPCCDAMDRAVMDAPAVQHPVQARVDGALVLGDLRGWVTSAQCACGRPLQTAAVGAPDIPTGLLAPSALLILVDAADGGECVTAKARTSAGEL